MIYYNSNTINDWNFGDDNIIKVYKHGAVCYYKITSGDTPTPVQEPCFAVVDNISQYSDTEFEDVFNKADGKWYKLNNLSAYEEYGIYGSGRNVTTYEGKLTIDGDYEYIYSGSSWVSVGEVSGSTATLPDVPFTVNYNAKNYDANTNTLFKTSGQLADVNAVLNHVPTVNDGYLTISNGTKATISGYQTYFNRDNNNPNLTIISKQKTSGSGCHMFANRGSTYNWMYRPYATKLTLHGGSQQGSIAVTTQPVIESVRVNSNRLATYNNYTDNTSSTYSSFSYGGANSTGVALFAGYYGSGSEYFVGDFYWVYMSQNTLTDEQVQQVINYNEGGGGEPEYPMYYDEIQDPPNNLSFSSMTEAEAYECPWVGMKATIDGDKYIFSGDSQSGYEWVYQPSRLPDGYTEVEYIENTGTTSSNGAYLNLGLPLYNTIGNSFQISSRLKSEYYSASGYDDLETIINSESVSSPYYGFTYRYAHSSHILEFTNNPSGEASFSSTANTDGTTSLTISCNSTSVTDQVPLGLFASYNANYNTPYRFAKATIYSFTVVKNGTTVRDLVPAKRDNDSVYGLYDLITDTFYTSPNGNNFIGGDPV